MRSEMIFRAQEKVANRYKLCQTAAKVTRCLHCYSGNTGDAITDAFIRIAQEPCLAPQIPVAEVKKPVPSVEAMVKEVPIRAAREELIVPGYSWSTVAVTASDHHRQGCWRP
jgi:hypothetical protein